MATSRVVLAEKDSRPPHAPPPAAAKRFYRSSLLRSFPTLRAEDLANARAYIRAHRVEIDEQIRENKEA